MRAALNAARQPFCPANLFDRQALSFDTEGESHADQNLEGGA
jgi:hypothetical protein